MHTQHTHERTNARTHSLSVQPTTRCRYFAPTIERYADLGRCQFYASPSLYERDASVCCIPGSDCLQANGGLFLPGETPICTNTEFNSTSCAISTPTKEQYCPGQDGSCERYGRANPPPPLPSRYRWPPLAIP